MATDPEPDEPVINLDREGAMTASYPRRPDSPRFLEAQRGMPRVLLEALEGLIGKLLNL